MVSTQTINVPQSGFVYASDSHYTTINGSAFVQAEASSDGTGTVLPTGKTIKDRGDKYIPFTVKKVWYHKKMYSPCELIVEGFVPFKLDDGGKPTEGPTDILKMYNKWFAKQSIFIYEDKNSTGQNDFSLVTDCYLIYSVEGSSTSTNTAGLTITLRACSHDKRMDLKRYCETFYNKALVTDILDTNIGSTGMFNKNFFRINRDTNATFQHICLTSGSNKDKKDQRQPYLVQYNETFYNFLARTLNRCGEYLYFEHGMLVVGKGSKAATIDISTLKSAKVTYPRYIDYNLYTYLDNAETTGYYDYCGVLKQDKLTDGNGRYLHDEVFDNSDVYKIVESTDNLQGQRDVYPDGKAAAGTIGAVMQCNTWTEGLSTLGTKSAGLTVRGDITDDLKTDFENKDHSAMKHNATLQQSADVTADISFQSKFYANIEQDQKKQIGRRLYVRFTDNPSGIFMGDILQEQVVNDSVTSYTVDEIVGKWDLQVTTKTDGPKTTDVIVVHSSHSISAIEGNTTPYLGADRRTLKSAPQLAIVKDNKDPLRMGRLRVHYPWDLSDNLTPWIRVAVPVAYASGGFNCTQAEGDEVVIDYENGNMEKPYVAGSVYTKANRPACGAKSYYAHAGKLKISNDPECFCISNRTGQSITLNNGKDCSRFMASMIPGGTILGAIKGASGATWNTPKLDGDITLTDACGITTIKQDTGARLITIDSPLGQIKLSAFDGISIMAPNGDIKIKGKNINLEAGNNITLKSGLNKTAFSYNGAEKGVGSDVLKTAINIFDEYIMYDTGFKGITGAIDCSFLRAVVEMIMRPLEGTTSIKSSGWVQLAGGKGKPFRELITPAAGSARHSFVNENNDVQYKKLLYPWAEAKAGWYKEDKMAGGQLIPGGALAGKGADGKPRYGASFLQGLIDTAADVVGLSSWEGLCEDAGEFVANFSSKATGGIMLSNDNGDVYLNGLNFSALTNEKNVVPVLGSENDLDDSEYNSNMRSEILDISDIANLGLQIERE